jgi:hypothetical protein
MRRVRAAADSLAALKAKSDTTGADSTAADTSAVADTLTRAPSAATGRVP